MKTFNSKSLTAVLLCIAIIFSINFVFLFLNFRTFFDQFETVKQEMHFESEEKFGPKLCGRFPFASDIIRDNEIWQELKIPGNNLKLLNAYFDDRGNETVVRVNVHSKELNITKDLIYCQFWFEDKKQPFVVKSIYYTYMWEYGLRNQ
jgi:hypothetical protein